MNTKEEILRILAQRIGLDPYALGPRTLDAALRRRMHATGVNGLDSYLRAMRNSPDELGSLVDEIIVPETWFFRDIAPFDFLERWVRTEFLKRHGGRRLRALSAGSSTGEEAYSIAATLLSTGLKPEQVDVLGVDICRRSLEAARRGLYRKRIVRPEMAGQYRRFFRRRNGEVEVTDELKSCVRFRHANLIDKGLLAGEDAFDVILCRNVLIYHSAEARNQVFRAFARLLATDGLLLVGHAEPLRVPRNLFEPAGPPGAFAFRRARASTQPSLAPARREPRRELPRIEWRTATVTDGGLGARADSVAAARRLADRGMLEEAAGICEAEIRRAPAAEAYCLLGTIRRAEGRDIEARAAFEKAVYLDSTHPEALQQLALLAERDGDRRMAGLYRERVRRAASTEASV